MTAIGVWPDCAASKRLYRRVWFLWCVKRSKWSRTNTTLWLLWLPKRERDLFISGLAVTMQTNVLTLSSYQREREREREKFSVACVCVCGNVNSLQGRI